MVNRNKKSLVLDLKRPAAREAILRLAATADVFVHNMRTGAAARLGIDYRTIRRRQPAHRLCLGDRLPAGHAL
jgi:crotonobetainyl-CoA:carnitine CoA-transferase CaiB-like acyl-CoA transferase